MTSIEFRPTTSTSLSLRFDPTGVRDAGLEQRLTYYGTAEVTSGRVFVSTGEKFYDLAGEVRIYAESEFIRTVYHSAGGFSFTAKGQASTSRYLIEGVVPQSMFEQLAAGAQVGVLPTKMTFKVDDRNTDEIWRIKEGPFFVIIGIWAELQYPRTTDVASGEDHVDD
jgi:hypothetical protein